MLKEGIKFCILTNLKTSFKESEQVAVLFQSLLCSFQMKRFFVVVGSHVVVYTKETNHCEPWNISERAPGRVPSQFITYRIATLWETGAEETLRHSSLFFCCCFFFFYFLFLKWSYKGRRIAWWFCLHKHQLQWDRKIYTASILACTTPHISTMCLWLIMKQS